MQSLDLLASDPSHLPFTRHDARRRESRMPVRKETNWPSRPISHALAK